MRKSGRLWRRFGPFPTATAVPIYEDWPYALFTMIHGQSEGDCIALAEDIKVATGLDEYALLYSTKEYKKVRVQYFTEDYARYLDAENRPRRVAAS